MKKGYWFAIFGAAALVLALGLAIRPSSSARGATGCTCPTGCSTRTTITAPFSYSGAGEFCWESTELGSYIQSWGADTVQVTGVDYTNLYVVTDQMLRDTTGTYYVYYKASTANGNFSAVGSSGITGCHAAWCSIAQYSSMLFSPFTMFNNIWGATSGQMISVESASNWWVNANFPETSGVKSYPNASLDLSGKTISTLGSCTSSFSVTVPSSGSWEAAYDLWVPSEIMIWMNKNGAVGPIAQAWNNDGTPVISVANLTVGGHTWDVYHGGANVVSFVRQGNINSGSVDILALLNWTKSQGWIGDGPLGKFQFGFEITSAPGGLTFTTNGYSISCGGLGGGGGGATPTISRTPTRTATGATSTPTRTPTRTATVLTATASRTATRTNTATGPTRTFTRTPTRTSTPTGATATFTRTATGNTGSTCSPVNATITAPFTYDGAGTFCWQASNLGSYINSWNLTSLTVNGVDYTNKYVFTSALPAKINGYWYVSYTGNYGWSHFEAK